METNSGLHQSQMKPCFPGELASEQAIPVSARRVLGSTGISALVHLMVFVVLSLIVLSQREPPPELMTEVSFTEQENDDEGLAAVAELDLPEVEAKQIESTDTTTYATSDFSVAASEVKLDLAPFGTFASDSSGMGLPDGIAEIASGIQKRVAEAGGRKGVVQFSLAWQSQNDVDLHVITPGGEHISYSRPNSSCSGSLDVDMNASVFSDEPVENVRWLDRSAPTGRYTILIHQFRWRSGQRKDDFQLLVKLGDRTELIEGTVTTAEPISIHRFQYVRSNLSDGRRAKMAAELSALQVREEAEATAILERGMALKQGDGRDRVMMSVISRFPHTDASIRAMQELSAPEKELN